MEQAVDDGVRLIDFLLVLVFLLLLHVFGRGQDGCRRGLVIGVFG
jgi:hypothetical protein